MISPNSPSASSMLTGTSTGQPIDITTIQDSKAQALSDITELQNIEKEYFSKIQQGTSNLTDQEKETIIKKINEISQMRVNLYKNLNQMYTFYNVNVGSTKDTMSEQAAAITIVENELNEAKKRLRFIEDQKYNKLRLVEINEYYGLRYQDHTKIMQILIVICVLLLICSVLHNRGLLPNNLFRALVFIIIFIGGIFLVRQLYHTLKRDNMNYQEYNWNFDPRSAPTVDTSSSGTDPWGSGLSLTCIGQQCCDTGYIYDPDANKCLLSSSSSTSETADTSLGSVLYDAASRTYTGATDAVTSNGVYKSVSNSVSVPGLY